VSGQREADQPDSEQGGDLAAPRPVAKVILLVGLALTVVLGVIIVVIQTTGAGSPQSDAGAGTSMSSTTPVVSPEPGSPNSAANTSPSPANPTGPTTASPIERPTSSPKPQRTRSPVPIKTPTEVKAGLTATITDVAAVQGKASGPGEVAGPAVRFTLRLRNDSAEAVPLDTTVVNLYYGKAKTPASALSKPGGTPLPATVAAGGEAAGRYLFVVPRKARDRVLITVDYSVDVSLVAFRGAVPR
jgi:hypothetical protein